MSASPAASKPPCSVTAGSELASPEMIGAPSPPAPMVAPIVAVATLTTTETRTPAKMTGAATGNSARHSTWVGLRPIARALSSMVDGTASIPPIVFWSTGKIP